MDLEGEYAAETKETRLIAAPQAGQRLDVFVAGTLEGATRAEAQRLIEMPAEAPEGVWVNGKREKASYRVREGDTVTVTRPQPQPTHVEAEAIPLPILYEDADLMVIDKPRGMVVHPAR